MKIITRIFLFVLLSASCIDLNASVLPNVNPFEEERYASEVFSEVICVKDVKFGNSISQAGVAKDLLMDVYMPKGDTLKNRPLIVFAHGGYFIFGDKESFNENAECDFFALSGYVVASINYRLIDVAESDVSSKRAVIDAVHDLKAAVRFFYKDAANENKFGIDNSQVFIGGYSAGAVTSLHYAYANTEKDVLEMGGEALFDYVAANGGLEGESGNPGYSSKVKGVINMAGSLHSSNLMDRDEPILVSLHGTNDVVVPFMSGNTGETTVVTEGSGLLHLKADAIGLNNKLIKVEGEGHLARFYCQDCRYKIRSFIFDNLDL